MLRKTLTVLMFSAAVTLAGGFAVAAEPTLHEVYQAAESGRLKEAEAMMSQVLREHPNSAKAHFVEAELLARDGRPDSAKAELATAERLEPGLPFAKAQSVEALRSRLNATPATPRRVVEPALASPAAPAATEFPWTLVLLGGGLLVAAIFFFRSLNRPRILPASGGPGYGPGGGYPQPYGAGGAGPIGPAAGGGMGSGILGGLATGAAVGAGMIAGEALMHRVLDGGHHDASVVPPAAPLPDSGNDMGGSDFGVADGGSWDDGGGGGDSSDW
jgi:hypothetical protein